MTIEAYRRATEILKEKERLEEIKYHLDPEIDLEKYTDICNRLFELGQAFAVL